MSIFFAKKKLFRTIAITNKNHRELQNLNTQKKLALNQNDLLTIQKYFQSQKRQPTDLELETIAQTWSEHCKHRIFNAKIYHQTKNANTQTINSIFKTFIQKPTQSINQKKNNFATSTFTDNAGFIKLNKTHSACFKVETHNHPSAIQPYNGASTGIGGVIRDIIGAGLGAKPIAATDIFCIGEIHKKFGKKKSQHANKTLQGITKGVSDYANRIGIPTCNGSFVLDKNYTQNPLVFCGTVGIIPTKDINKKVENGDLILVAGGLTGRDGLKGATFASEKLQASSTTDNQNSVPTPNPFEEKKLTDFIIAARQNNLIKSITDCGAGGLSSAVGELLAKTGGKIYLEKIPIKTSKMHSWEIFLSESQERMVICTSKKKLRPLKKIAKSYGTNLHLIGKADDSQHLQVIHSGTIICNLNCKFLHQDLPRLKLKSNYPQKKQKNYTLPKLKKNTKTKILQLDKNLPQVFQKFLANPNICSRAPIIRQYDFEVQGNTILKPLAGKDGNCPQNSAVITPPPLS